MSGIVSEKWSARQVDIVATSGTLCVTIHPRRDWHAGLASVAWDAMFVVILYRFWSRMPSSFRVMWIAILAAASLSLAYGFLCEEILEFDSEKLTIRRGARGWERKREYSVEQCSNLGWRQGGKSRPYLAMSVVLRSVTFGKGLSEDAANAILTALQRVLPDVAQKMCSYPGSNDDHGSLIIFRSASVRPKHLFDQNFDHD
jgi:hypothetical protein